MVQVLPLRPERLILLSGQRMFETVNSPTMPTP
jgi:hypothetical protein